MLAIAMVLVAGCGSSDSPTGVDREPPAVVRTEPTDGAVAVDPEQVLRVVFSEPVVIDSTITAPLRVVGSEGPLAGPVELDSTATMLTLTPVLPIPIGDEYQLILAAGIADRSGNVRPDSLVVRFTTSMEWSDIGRVFIANTFGEDMTVLDLETFEEVEGSPLPLGVVPFRMVAVREEGVLYVLYTDWVNGDGVLVVDGRSLAILRDTGPVMSRGMSDLVVSTAHDLLFVSYRDGAQVWVFDSQTLEEVREPLYLDRPDAEPRRLDIARRLDYLLVGMQGGGRLGAYHLPSLEPVAGFPASATDGITDIEVDEDSDLAWVTGRRRFAVVDLLNGGRTESFQVPVVPCTYCTPYLWRVILAPHLDRAIFMFRRQTLASVHLSTLEVSQETPGNLFIGNRYLSDVEYDPRSGNLILLGWGSVTTPMYMADPATLLAVPGTLPEAGSRAQEMEVLP